jgi:hypothetical protein
VSPPSPLSLPLLWGDQTLPRPSEFSSFPDGQNTVSFGPFNSSVFNQSTHLGTIAYTCWAFNGYSMTEGDIYFGSNVDFWNSLPSPCYYAQDLQTAATHEWGHVFGMAHETSGPDEVMYPRRGWCTLRRHLGNGDFFGMALIYGYR